MIKNSRKASGLWILLFLLMQSFCSFAYEPTPDQKNKEAVTKTVYRNIVRSIGDGRQAPILIFAFNKTTQENYTTYYSPKRKTIIVGEGIYNIAVSFGADSLDALAFVIGHELSHYYKDHGWGMSFGAAPEDFTIAKEIYDSDLTMDRKKIMEAEADYFGCLYGYLAGYNTLKVGGKFISAFYDIGVSEVTPGYPSKEDRIKIVGEVNEKLAQLIPIYETANMLSLVGNYEESARCFEHVATFFPSREIYNNAGVNKVVHAFSLFKKEEYDYFYPFGLDEGSRLNQGGAKGGEIILREELLKEAITHFEKATQLDKNYIPAYINTALSYDLIGEKEMALAMASKAVRMAEEKGDTALMANALIAKGIVQAHLDNEKAAKLSFNGAMIGNERIAKLNLSVLKKGKPFQDLMSKKESAEILSKGLESINEVDPSLMEVLLEDAQMISLKSQTKERRKMKVYSYNKDGIKALHVKHFTKPINEQSFIFTDNEYGGSTARGIKQNDQMDEVIKAYGIPAKITSGIKGNYFVYKQTRIIFRTNEHDRVSDWILY